MSSIVGVTLSDQVEGRHHLVLEMAPLTDAEIQLCLGEVNQHSSNLRGLGFTHDLFDVLVDGVADDLLLRLSVGGLELL